MKCICLAVILVLGAWCSAEETYSTEHDHFDVDGLVADPVKLKAFVDCFQGTGSCDPITTHFKKTFPEAVQQGCAKCNQKQKYILKHFLEGVKKQLPEEFEKISKAVDPEGKLIPAVLAQA